MGRRRTKRTRRDRLGPPKVHLTDCQCELHRAGIEDPFPPGIGRCACACQELHPNVAACGIDVPAARILQIRIDRREWNMPVCVPCGNAVAQTYGGDR